MADVFEKEFWFGKVKTLCIDEFRVRIWNVLPPGHFEEAIDDEDEFCNSWAKWTSSAAFFTLVTVFSTALLMDFRVELHLYKNCFLPRNSCLPKCSSL